MNMEVFQSALSCFNDANPELLRIQLESRERYESEHPLQKWGLDELLRYGVKPLCNLLFDRTESLEARLDNWNVRSDPYGDAYSDGCYTLRLAQVACSQAIIALLAPLAETLMYKSIESFRQELEENTETETNEDERSALNKKDFWNPKEVFVKWDKSDKNNPRVKKKGGIREGFSQLIRSIGLGAEMSSDCENVLTALFAIRNISLHRIVWSEKKDQDGKDAAHRFSEDMAKSDWGEWFTCTRIYSSDEPEDRVELAIEDITVTRCGMCQR